MNDLIILSAISFVQVFSLGFQSRLVNHGHYVMAFGMSFFIGMTQAVVWRKLTAENSTAIEAVVYSLSGAIGIVCAMKVHSWMLARKAAKDVAG